MVCSASSLAMTAAVSPAFIWSSGEKEDYNQSVLCVCVTRPNVSDPLCISEQDDSILYRLIPQASFIPGPLEANSENRRGGMTRYNLGYNVMYAKTPNVS